MSLSLKVSNICLSVLLYQRVTLSLSLSLPARAILTMPVLHQYASRYKAFLTTFSPATAKEEGIRVDQLLAQLDKVRRPGY